MSERAYFTVKEAAAALDITDDGVRKLITRGKLPAIRRSERNILIPGPAFDAYVRRLNGQTTPAPERLRTQDDLETRLAQFERDAGKTPQQWLTDWTTSEPELDTAKNMAFTVSAAGLVAEQHAAASASPGTASGIITAEDRRLLGAATSGSKS